MSPVLLDTGFLFALVNKHENRHQECLQVFQQVYQPIVTCEAVIAECCYLLSDSPAGREAVLQNVHSGLFQIPFRIADSAPRVLEILKKYADTPADYADACLIQMADELDTGDILTLDSHFRHYRWRRNRRFNLLVPLD